jgi:hypothetical protein
MTAVFIDVLRKREIFLWTWTDEKARGSFYIDTGGF